MIYSLHNQNLRVEIDSQGAQLVSLFNSLTQTEHLWQADPAIWPWHAPNLFPVVGNQTNDQILVDGQTYPLKRHGFARNSPFTCTTATPTLASFELRSSDETKRQYPYDFVFEITYAINGPELTITYRVRNMGADLMYMSVGAHPAFNVPFQPGADSGEAYADYYLEFEQDDELDVTLLEADGLLSEKQTVMPLTNRQLTLTPTLFNQDALVLLSLKSRQITLKSRQNTQSVAVRFEAFPFLGVWAKPGAPFVCIEPWLGVADTSNQPRPIEAKQGIQQVRANEEFAASFTITLA